MDRKAEVNRLTKETNISIKLELDGEGNAAIDTGIGFSIICSKGLLSMDFLI